MTSRGPRVGAAPTPCCGHSSPPSTGNPAYMGDNQNHSHVNIGYVAFCLKYNFMLFFMLK